MATFFAPSFLIASVFLAAPPAATRPSEINPTLLAGPSVDDDGSATRGIVHRNFDGTLQDIGPEPDVAAIESLDLTPQQREAFEMLRTDRAGAFDKLVRANYTLIVELASLQGQGEPQPRLRLLSKVREAFAPYMKRGSLLDEFSSVLTADQRPTVNAMVDEFQQARAQELRRIMGPDATLRQIAQRARLEAFGHMVRQSIERQVGIEKQNFEQLATELDLSEAQKAKAQAIFGPLAVQRLQDKAVEPAERGQAMREFSKMLMPEQRRKLFGILVQQWHERIDSNAAGELEAKERAEAGD
jgi:hypothetical protein